MPFAAALSEHPESAHAVGECLGQLLDAHGPHPDLVLLFAAGGHARHVGAMASAMRALLRPGCLVGVTGDAIIGGPRESEAAAAVSAWAAWGVGDVAAIHLVAGPAGAEPVGWDRLNECLGADDEDAGGHGSERTAIVFADPFTFPVDELLDRLAVTHPRTVVVGGLCAGRRPGDVVFQVDDAPCAGGAVVVVLEGRAGTVVSQGCRPVGEPFTVTRSNGPVLEELGSRAALTRLQELALSLGPEDRALLARSVLVGRVVDEHLAEHGRGDFLVRQVLGTRTASGGVVVGEHIPVGATVQFQLRDAVTAHEDLVELLAGQEASGALLFSCTGRGSHLFGEPDHDARTVCELLGTDAVAGLFCIGEVGPVGFRSFLHGFTASVVLFRERSDRS